MKVLAIRARAPLLSSRSSPPDILPFQVAVIPPLPLPPTLIGAFLRAFCRLFPPDSALNVDESAELLLRDFLNAGFWATCGFISEFSSLAKASVLLKRARTLEEKSTVEVTHIDITSRTLKVKSGKGKETEVRISDKIRVIKKPERIFLEMEELKIGYKIQLINIEDSDAMIREYSFLPHWVLFFLLPEELCSSKRLNEDDLKRISFLIDRVGDTESLITPVQVEIYDSGPSTNSEAPLNTVTPQDFFEKFPTEGVLWRGLGATTFHTTARRSKKKKEKKEKSRDYFLPLTLRSAKGYEWYDLQPLASYQIKPDCQLFTLSIFGMDVTMVYKPVS